MSTNLSTFQIILDFVNELNDMFGKHQIPLQVYHRLLSKTKVSNTKMIDAQLTTFRNFCVQNRAGICERNINKISNKKIKFTDRMFIDLEPIFKSADKETIGIIWKHLLSISAILDRESGARQILSSIPSGLTDLVATMTREIEESGVVISDNPMEMMASLMSSGAIPRIMTRFQEKMESGELDIASLIPQAMSMLGEVQDPQLQAMVQNLTSQIPPSEPVRDNVEEVD